MPLLNKGKPAEDGWILVDGDAPIPAEAPAIVALPRVSEVPAGREAPLGVLTGAATQAVELAPLLNRVALVAVPFPKFRDGRGFTLARSLRERYGFTGEIRAVGHVLPDQHLFLLRCGFTSVAVPEGADLAPWIAGLGRFHMAYQGVVTDAAPHRHPMRRFG